MNSKSKFMLGAYWLLFVGGLMGCYIILTGRSYPIKQVALPKHECKIENWSNLGENCKQDLPRMTNANYSEYSNNFAYTSIYSDLWGSSYSNGRDTTKGSSPGIDIATSAGTPVYATAEGEVIHASYAPGVGNSITIKHRRKNTYIYTSYSHLSVMNVNVGDSVFEGQLIGEVGKTGTTMGTYGNHLDFQITTTKQRSYPYSYHDCPEGTYYQIIQQGLCRDKLAENTIDPIAFIESNGSIGLPDKNDSIFQKKTFDINTNSVGEVKQFVASSIVKDTVNQDFVSQNNNETDGYNYKIVGLTQRDIAELGRQFKFYIIINDSNGLPAEGKLLDQIKISDSNGTLDFDKVTFNNVQNGTIKIGVIGKKVGSSIIKITIGKQVIGSYMIEIIDSNLAMNDGRSKNARGSITIPAKTPTLTSKSSGTPIKLTKLDVGVATKIAKIKSMNSGLAQKPKLPTKVLAKVNTTSNKSIALNKSKNTVKSPTLSKSKQLSKIDTNKKTKTTFKKPIIKVALVKQTKVLAKTNSSKSTIKVTAKKLSYVSIDTKSKLLAKR